MRRGSEYAKTVGPPTLTNLALGFLSREQYNVRSAHRSGTVAPRSDLGLRRMRTLRVKPRAVSLLVPGLCPVSGRRVWHDFPCEMCARGANSAGPATLVQEHSDQASECSDQASERSDQTSEGLR